MSIFEKNKGNFFDTYKIIHQQLPLDYSNINQQISITKISNNKYKTNPFFEDDFDKATNYVPSKYKQNNFNFNFNFYNSITNPIYYTLTEHFIIKL